MPLLDHHVERLPRDGFHALAQPAAGRAQLRRVAVKALQDVDVGELRAVGLDRRSRFQLAALDLLQGCGGADHLGHRHDPELRRGRHRVAALADDAYPRAALVDDPVAVRGDRRDMRHRTGLDRLPQDLVDGASVDGRTRGGLRRPTLEERAEGAYVDPPDRCACATPPQTRLVRGETRQMAARRLTLSTSMSASSTRCHLVRLGPVERHVRCQQLPTWRWLTVSRSTCGM